MYLRTNHNGYWPFNDKNFTNIDLKLGTIAFKIKNRNQ